eukprot:4302257-Amphidinium_carterae.2
MPRHSFNLKSHCATCFHGVWSRQDKRCCFCNPVGLGVRRVTTGLWTEKTRTVLGQQAPPLCIQPAGLSSLSDAVRLQVDMPQYQQAVNCTREQSKTNAVHRAQAASSSTFHTD